MLADNEAEAQMLRARFKQLTDESLRYKKENGELAGLVQKTRDVSLASIESHKRFILCRTWTRRRCRA